MPFFIQQPPILDIPRTFVEIAFSEKNRSRSSRVKSFEVNNDIVQQVYLRDKFTSLRNAWERETMFSSSVGDIIENSNFKRIVEMGNQAIPLIIDEIEAHPSNLVWALNIITNATINSNSRITLTEACKAWVKLYRTGKIQY